MAARIQRKLTTILAADAAGYSRLMEADEVHALGKLHAARAVFARFIDRHQGRIANTAGDGLIAEFPSVVEAVQCAIEVQQELDAHQDGGGDPMRFRIGIHLGDVIVDGNDLLGEGVNLAARLQTMAEPGGVLISQQVYDQVHAKLSVGFDYLGERRPKNYAEDVAVYRVAHGAGQPAPRRRRTRRAPDTAPARTAPPAGQDAPIADLREGMIRRARLTGFAFTGLLVIDVATGGGLWVQWPGLLMAVYLGWGAAPLVTSGRRNVFLARAAMAVIAIALIDLFA